MTISSDAIPALYLGELPSFVKDLRSPGAALPAVHYWQPERTGDHETDYSKGRGYLLEAVGVPQPGDGMFLPYVVMAMYGRLGAVEQGFLDALLTKALAGMPAPPLTEQEMAATGNVLVQERVHEKEMAEAIACRKWAPDMAGVQLFAMLSGVVGENIGAAITMIARTALNGTRH